MSGGSFSAHWLQQREPFDTQARNGAAARLGLQARLEALRPSAATPWRVIDLACGTGANLRWLAPRLGGAQQWLAVDHDAALLRCWPERLNLHGGTQAFDTPLRLAGEGFEAHIVRQQLDLAQHLENLPWHAAHLVTASALLDLVSADWLQRLVALAVASRVALLFTLSVDGRHEWSPADAMDAAVGRLFDEHQRRDKGFGPAVGAWSLRALRRALEDSGYRLLSAPSDWRIDSQDGPEAGAMHHTLVDGIANAACEQAPASIAALEAWRQRRHARAATGQLRVGHRDVLALP